jgi:TetR/AcrR family fatty acid metabolism transcriptional regulator
VDVKGESTARSEEPIPWQRPTTGGILRAAERVFARQGYAETSLRRLIAEAGVSTTAFYARFPSKEAVLDALIAELLGELYEAAARALGEARTLEEGFDRGVEVLVRVLADRRDLVRLALTEASCSGSARGTIQAAYSMLASLLGAKFKHLVDRGSINLIDAEAFGWALVGALQMQVVRWAVYDELDDEGLARSLRSTARSLLPLVQRPGE